MIQCARPAHFMWMPCPVGVSCSVGSGRALAVGMLFFRIRVENLFRLGRSTPAQLPPARSVRCDIELEVPTKIPAHPPRNTPVYGIGTTKPRIAFCSVFALKGVPFLRQKRGGSSLWMVCLLTRRRVAAQSCVHVASVGERSRRAWISPIVRRSASSILQTVRYSWTMTNHVCCQPASHVTL